MGAYAPGTGAFIGVYAREIFAQEIGADALGIGTYGMGACPQGISAYAGAPGDRGLCP